MLSSSVKYIHLKETDSTNNYLRNYSNEKGKEMTVVKTEYQTAGKGQGKNTWESEAGKNLLFSVLAHPAGVPANRQFILSMAIALAVKDTLHHIVGDVQIKWPNDIYWHGHKMGGILIECTLSGGMVKDCIMGVGINVNQEEFTTVEKHPLSLIHIIHRKTDREVLLHDIIHNLHDYLLRIEHKRYDLILAEYEQSLFRGRGYHKYSDANGTFMARFISVNPTGHINLRDDDGMLRTYACKEVEFMEEE